MCFTRDLRVMSPLVWVSLLLVALPCAAIDSWVGKVIYVSEKLTAISPDASERILKRGSEIHPGDVLKTSERSRAQLRLRDDAVMVLRPDTEVRVDTFSYHQASSMQVQNESYSFKGSLLKGSIRIISGDIGKRDSDLYRMNTPVATISWVQNANYELVLGSGGLAVAVWEGSVMVENYAGSLILGDTADHVYTLINGIMTVPQGLTTPPDLALLYQDSSSTDTNEAGIDEIKADEVMTNEIMKDKGDDGVIIENK